MINLWSHYLSTFAALRSLLILFIVQQVTGICSLLGKESVLAMDASETPNTKECLYHNRYKTRAVLFVQGHVYDLKTSFLLYSSSKAEVILLN